MASKILVDLDTSKEIFINSKCKQNDDLILEANIYENGLAKDLTNCSISIQALKADKTYIIQNTDIAKEKNKFIANLVKDFTRVAGKTEIEVVLTESSKQNTTFSFCLNVIGSVIKGAVESSNTVTILENLQDKIEEAGQVKAETEQLIEKGGAATKGDIAEVNSHLEQNKQELTSKINEVATTGTTIEVVQSKVDEMAKQGLIQAYTLGDKTLEPIKTTFFGDSKNLIDYSKTVSGQFVNQGTGTFDVSSSHRRTEKLMCKSNTKYTFSYRHKVTGANIANNSAFRYATYNDNTFIKGNLNEFSFITPRNCNYIAVSWLGANDLDYNIQLEEGEMTEYTPYKQQIKNEYIDLSDITNRVNQLETKVDNVVTGSATNIIFDEDFKNEIPTFLTNTGFTLSGGLVNSSIGYDKQIYYNKEVCLDKELIKVDIELKDLNTRIGVGFRNAIAGLLCEVDFKNKKLIIRQGWSDPTSITPPNVFLETPITFDLVLNRVYSIIVEKDTRKNCSIKLIDTITLNETLLDCVEKSMYSPVNAWGGACIVAIEGLFKVNRFSFINNQPSSPLLAIYGDSFIEGTTLHPNVEKRYCALLKAKLNGDCIIGGKGGEVTKGIIDKIETYSKFRPRYTLLAVGLNDTVFSAYQERITTLINWCESIGSTPILCTLTRNMATDNLTFLRQVNDFVRNSGYRYIDFAKVMSVNGDGETQDTTLFLADKVHPNITGHDRMYKKALIDIYDIVNQL